MDQRIIDANILVHTAMASTYNENEPHFRAENKAVVRKHLVRLRSLSGPRLLDVGCGTGFIISLADDLFSEIHGVDITQAMLDRVERGSGSITLHRSLAEEMPFSDGYFDAASAYSFIHHLADYSDVLHEVHRVLKPGGTFYVDLDPNRTFWSAINAAQKTLTSSGDNPSDILAREIDSVLHTDDRVECEFGIASETFNLAENYKDILGGIDPDDFQENALRAGFTNCEVGYYWYLGQGCIMHGQSAEHAGVVEAYLMRALPVSAPLFKYLRFFLTK
jgi:Methylase involved in ubiquinone/menaquinone biosynthesis